MQEVRGSSPRVTTRLLQRGAAPATAAGAALRKRALGRRDHMLRPFGAEVRRGRRDGGGPQEGGPEAGEDRREQHERARRGDDHGERARAAPGGPRPLDRKSTRLNSSHPIKSYSVFYLKKKKTTPVETLQSARTQ